MDALVDQGSDVNVMPLSTYNRLTNEQLVETDIRISLSSQSQIQPLRIAEGMLVEIARFIYLVDFVILDIREDQRKLFILGTPFVTTAKAEIRKRNDKFNPVTTTSTINKLILEWEERIKLHQEKEKDFNQWRSRKAHLLEDKKIPSVGVFDELSKRKFVIVCHEKVVRIPLEGDEILQVHGERTQGVVKTLMNTKVVEFRIDLVHEVTPVAKSPYHLAPSEMQELSEQLQELQDEVLELLRKEKLYAKFTKSEVVKNWEVPTTPSEI
ncbi:reverse transcriptase domain-containing protein [Tanacetum coccineum]|uniref:Reverse transcriptase domain-containing protein n=1 Tax=Tanacetum coccineum TaxID=301880 RepID=A0ABQ5FLD8_9ASTR